jgi:hypothetical protein
MAGSKNNPDNRKGEVKKDKWVQVVGDGKRKMAKEVDGKLYDKDGREIV